MTGVMRSSADTWPRTLRSVIHIKMSDVHRTQQNTFQRVDRTLTDAEVSKAVDAVVRMLQHRFGAEQR